MKDVAVEVEISIVSVGAFWQRIDQVFFVLKRDAPAQLIIERLRRGTRRGVVERADDGGSGRLCWL